VTRRVTTLRPRYSQSEPSRVRIRFRIELAIVPFHDFCVAMTLLSVVAAIIIAFTALPNTYINCINSTRTF
jgi:hypothetical protein